MITRRHPEVPAFFTRVLKDGYAVALRGSRELAPQGDVYPFPEQRHVTYNSADLTDSDRDLSAVALSAEDLPQATLTVAGVTLCADLSGALYWADQRLLIVSDLHLEKGSSYAMRGQLLPPYDTIATLGRLGAVLAHYDPRTVIALGDSFHDRDAHGRLTTQDRGVLSAMQSRRDWVWISGNHDPDLPDDLGGTVADEVAIGTIAFRHEPTGAIGEIAGHLHPKARVSTRGRSVERRCFASDGERAIMPAFGAYAGGLSIRDAAFAKVLHATRLVAHVLGDRRMHAIAASRCY